MRESLVGRYAWALPAAVAAVLLGWLGSRNTIWMGVPLLLLLVVFLLMVVSARHPPGSAGWAGWRGAGWGLPAGVIAALGYQVARGPELVAAGVLLVLVVLTAALAHRSARVLGVLVVVATAAALAVGLYFAVARGMVWGTGIY
jgi:hypothetical protein